MLIMQCLKPHPFGVPRPMCCCCCCCAPTDGVVAGLGSIQLMESHFTSQVRAVSCVRASTAGDADLGFSCFCF